MKIERAILTSLAVLAMGGGQAAFAKNLHPLDRFMMSLSEDIKGETQQSRFNATQTMSECTAFFIELGRHTEGTSVSTEEAQKGIQTMTRQIKDITTLIWSLHSATAIGDVEHLIEEARGDEALMLRANGLDSLNVLSRYDECLHVYYLANDFALKGQTVMD